MADTLAKGFQSVLFKNNLTTRVDTVTHISEPPYSTRKKSKSVRHTDPESIHIHDGGSTAGIANATGPKSSYETVNREERSGSNGNGIYRTVEWTILQDDPGDPYKRA